MEYFMDVEFMKHTSKCGLESNTEFSLLSVYIVSEKGEYYAMSSDFALGREDELLKGGAFVRVRGERGYRPLRAIKTEIEEFIGEDTDVRFWCTPSVDKWQAFCTIWGGFHNFIEKYSSSYFTVVRDESSNIVEEIKFVGRGTEKSEILDAVEGFRRRVREHKGSLCESLDEIVEKSLSI